MTDRPTYPEILKLFYRHSFPDQLGAPASSVAQAIIYKANDLYFPNSFQMSNIELSILSGEDVSNIGRTRQKVLDICKVGEKYLFNYRKGTTRRAGTYSIDYSLTSTQRQLNVNSTSTQRQDTPLIDNNPNSTLPNETKPSQSTVNKVTTGKGADLASKFGGGILATSEKTEDEAKTVNDELRYHRVNGKVRDEIVGKYETRYIYRQILQMRKDFLNGIVFKNPGGALVARIRSGHRTEDYPE